MRDWNAYAEHLRAMREQDPAGVFVGADVVLELIEERCMLIRTMVRIVHGEDDLCRYCANSTPDACMMHGGTCADLSLMLASLLHCAGKYPALLLFNGHMDVFPETETDDPDYNAWSGEIKDGAVYDCRGEIIIRSM